MLGFDDPQGRAAEKQLEANALSYSHTASRCRLVCQTCGSSQKRSNCLDQDLPAQRPPLLADEMRCGLWPDSFGFRRLLLPRLNSHCLGRPDGGLGGPMQGDRLSGICGSEPRVPSR